MRSSIAFSRPLRDERKNGLFAAALALSLVIHAVALAWPASRHAAEQRVLPPLFATLRLLPSAPERQEIPPVANAAPVAAVAIARTKPASQPSSPTRPRIFALAAPAPVSAAVTAAAADLPLPPAAALPAVASAAEPPAARREAADAEALERYMRTLSELLARQQRYPRLAELRGWEGEVQLRVHVARQGNIVAVELLHSSGFNVLDQHAVQLVQGAVPPPPPAGVQDSGFQITVPIHYKLQKST